MAVSDEYLGWVLDQLSELGPVASRRMFGGAGLSLDGVTFGLVDDDVTYFKAGDESRLDYVERGSEPFRPAPGQSSTTWYAVPPDVLENPEELADWARRALAVAAATRKPPRKRKR